MRRRWQHQSPVCIRWAVVAAVVAVVDVIAAVVGRC